MAEAEHNFVENNEQQNFSLPDSDQHELTVDEFEQHNITGDLHAEYTYPENDAENQGLLGHEQGFTGIEPENNFEMISEQTYAENENEQTLDGEEPDQGLDGIELKQEFPENEGNETHSTPDDSHVDDKEEHGNSLVGVVEEKKWPGWPGDSVFRMLVPGQKVGNIIGRKGEYIKKMVEETRARIKILDGPPGSQERAVFWQFLRLQIRFCCHSIPEALKMQMLRSAWALQLYKCRKSHILV